MVTISPSLHIFRAYDIRGKVPDELNEDVACAIARVFAMKVAEIEGKSHPRISVGYDGRVSSPALKDTIVKGLIEGGAEVIDIGLGPTPLAYYSVFQLDMDGCVMITGSHNPPDYNGLKLMVGKRPFFGDDIQDLYHMLDRGEGVSASQPDSVTQQDVKPDYMDVLIEAAGQHQRLLKVVWDAGNGATGEVIQALVKRLPGEHEVLFGEIDGSFPNHHPDPSVEKNMQDLRTRVLESKADIGFAFDGDGDRIGVIDAKGRIWAGDQILAICAKDVLVQHPGSEIIADVKTSQGVFDAISTYGGKGIMWKTGHSHIKSKLAETKAPLAGEMSGHIFFADRYFGFDDAIYTAMRLLHLLGDGAQTSDALYDALPKWYSTPELRIDCEEAQKFDIIDAIAKQLDDEGKDYTDIDGVRVQTEKGWWLLRASNTQPVLVARAEAKNQKDLEGLKEDIAARLEPFGITL